MCYGGLAGKFLFCEWKKLLIVVKKVIRYYEKIKRL